jgi:hypothetical protein
MSSSLRSSAATYQAGDRFSTTADQRQRKFCSSGILRSGRLTLGQGQFITNSLFKLSGCLNGVVRLICLKSLLAERGSLRAGET